MDLCSIDYTRYVDKVFGCWMGKCVAGTIGAPYEGAKELFDFEYNPSIIENMLANDDLDLQVLWLSVLEEKGVNFTSNDLADAFLNRCSYAPGEYAVFRKNYSRGVHPPMSGKFNNRYYINGMGCPIRSEIWGCISPGNPRLAAGLAAKDGCLDHSGASIYSEQFLAALEAAAFFENDPDALIDVGLGVIPADSKTAELITNVRRWCKSGRDWRYVRSQIIRDYGHPDCTNMFQNIGITLLSLYFGEGDFLKTVMIALNCGFDTDCTCATAGAILGLIYGADYLMRTYGFTDQGFVLGVDAPRRSDRVLHLAEDTCRMGLHFAEHLNKSVRITDAPEPPAIEAPAVPPIGITAMYDEIPAIGIGETRGVDIILENTTDATITGTVSLQIPDGWSIDRSSAKVAVEADGGMTWRVSISVPSNIKILQETNLLIATFTPDAGEPVTYSFGMIGAAVWEVFGPFWENCTQMPRLKLGESYHKHIPGSDSDNSADNIRAYHLNTTADLNKEYMSLDELLNPGAASDAYREGRLVNTYEDKISAGDLIGFKGPCVVYMVRRLVCPEKRTLGIEIGHTDAYKLWIDGKLVSERDSVDWWTAENAHIHGFELQDGENTIVVRLTRRSDNADFSLIFCKTGACSPHYTDFASRNPHNL